MGGEWPDNDFTRHVVKPDFEIQFTQQEADSFMVSFSNVTVQQMKAYADELRDAGFNLSEEENDEVAWGYYSFSADNADGYRVTVAFTSGYTAITFSFLG